MLVFMALQPQENDNLNLLKSLKNTVLNIFPHRRRLLDQSTCSFFGQPCHKR